MFDIPYEHQVIKQTVIAFGAIFENLRILRKKEDGTVGGTIAVPITYGPKEKVLVRLNQDANFDNQVLVTLPRMAFEINSYSYDTQRSPNRNQKITCQKNDGTTLGVYAPVPYNLGISLYLLAKGTQDTLNVIEQILPVFAPEYTATIKSIPDMNITQDVPFILNNVSTSDDYEGDFATRRLVTTQFDFTAKINLYGPYGNAGRLITRTDTNVNDSIVTPQNYAKHVATGNVTSGAVTDFWE